MSSLTKELTLLNANTKALLERIDGLYKKVDDKSKEGLDAIQALIDSGQVGESLNALKLEGKTLEQVQSESTQFLWSGGPSEHRNVNDEEYHYMSLDSIEYQHSQFDEYSEIIPDGNYGFRIKKAGYYQLSGSVMQHSNNRDARKIICVFKNEEKLNVFYNIGYTWTSTGINALAWMDENDVLKVNAKVHENSNSYQWHGVSTSKHTILHLQYLGSKK